MRTLTHPLAASAPSPGIDLAPMLDFVVNLLIFFLVTAVFVRDPAITLKRPSGETDAPGTARSIAIDDDGTISIDDKVVDLAAVRSHIEQFRAASSEASGVVIVAREHAPMGVVVAVADQVYLGGLGDITFSTKAASPGVIE
ncbi:MAG TPA: biopolymer transporter ExbD [Gammaproteobacteria bacterium]|nr:biopolymer transporter ExbD [Gammaproteobacteria bacterium]